MVRELQNAIKDAISHDSGSRPGNINLVQVGGGSINQCFKVQLAGGNEYFLKQNSAKNFPHLFELEKEGLEHLASLKCIRTPRVITQFNINDQQFLLMENIREGNPTSVFWKKFGEDLAKMHHHSREKFGFRHANYMGSLPQSNIDERTWVGFFREHRLEPQLVLATEKGFTGQTLSRSFQRLYSRLDKFFEPEPPSALHGDLWSGNFLCDENQSPVLLDPAVYFGHRSVDLGMSTLFGGFDKVFYSSYNYHFAFPANYQEQWEICNLYPLLIHLNLFGHSYLKGIENILRKYS